MASPLNKYPKDIQKQIAEKSAALKQELANKVAELEKQKSDQKSMVKWFKQFDALEEEKVTVGNKWMHSWRFILALYRRSNKQIKTIL